MRDYFEFKGVKYGIGTIVKVPSSTDIRWVSPKKYSHEATFIGNSTFRYNKLLGCITLYEDGSNLIGGKYEEYIEIIEPVYYQEPQPLPAKKGSIWTRTGSGSWDAHGDVCIGLIWYIVIMLVATIFKDRIAIWIITTIVFFSWKARK